MNFIKKIGAPYMIMLVLCAIIILIAEYVFLQGDELHGIFIGLWVPTLLCVLILVKLSENGRK